MIQYNYSLLIFIYEYIITQIAIPLIGLCNFFI